MQIMEILVHRRKTFAPKFGQNRSKNKKLASLRHLRHIIWKSTSWSATSIYQRISFNRHHNRYLYSFHPIDYTFEAIQTFRPYSKTLHKFQEAMRNFHIYEPL